MNNKKDISICKPQGHSITLREKMGQKLIKIEIPTIRN